MKILVGQRAAETTLVAREFVLDPAEQVLACCRAGATENPEDIHHRFRRRLRCDGFCDG
ncbi:MAG TPA: hypothetical protein VGK70_05640 [Thermoanaerobaculia bacterium]